MSKILKSANIELFSDDLKLIDKKFLESVAYFIKLLDGNGYVMATAAKRAYVYGYVCSYLWMVNDPYNPQEIKSLNGKNIIQIDQGEDFLVILTDEGIVYLCSNDMSWNTNGQLKKISGKYCFKKIACGSLYLLLLRDDGQLFAQGFGEYGRLGNGAIVDSYDQMVDTGLQNVRLISCGGSHSLALTTDNKLYSFGRNDLHQLGLDDDSERLSPTLVKFFSNQPSFSKIQDICAGVNLSSVLMKDNKLYIWGQVGKSHFRIGKFSVDNIKSIISSSIGYTTILLASTPDKFYAWIDSSEHLEIEKNVQSFPEAYLTIKPNAKPLSFGWIRNSKVGDMSNNFTGHLKNRFNDLFDNSSNYDFIFEFDDNQKIFGRKSYLKLASDYLNTLLSEDWCSKDSIKIIPYSYKTFYTFLKLLHFGESEIDESNLAELLDLSECYQEKRLRDLCIEYMVRNINFENFRDFYELTKTFRLDSVKESIKKFAKQELVPLIKETEFEFTDQELCDAFIKLCVINLDK